MLRRFCCRSVVSMSGQVNRAAITRHDDVTFKAKALETSKVLSDKIRLEGKG